MGSSTIELNGKKYDAKTGRIVTDAPTTKVVKKSVQPKGGMIMDGVSKMKPARENTVTNPAHRTLEKSKTLMRPAVKKPVIKNDISASPKKHVQHDAHTQSRALRAKHSAKSPLIKRFHTPSTVTKKHEPLAVAQPKAAHKPKAQATSAAKASATPAKANIFEQAIQGASSHLQEFDHKTLKKKGALHRVGFKHKGANIAALSVAGLLLFGFFAYQNKPSIEMKVAATRAGVQANMPDYKPAGYGAAGVKQEPGKVSVSFRSRTDDKAFTLTQQASNWNSASLLANTVAQTNTPYQTYQDEGKTVYIYNNSNATWVDGGIWYQIEGNASLTSDQLLRIANSL